MDVSVSTWSLKGSAGITSGKALIDAAKTCGLEALDLTLDDYYLNYWDWRKATEEEIFAHFSELGAYAKQQGVKIFQSHAPYGTFPKFYEEEFFTQTVKSIVATSAAGAKYCVIHSLIFPLYGKDLSENEMAFNMDFFARLLPYLKKYDVVACLENLYDRYFDKEKGYIREVFVSRPERLMQYLDRLDERYFGVCLDTGHLHMFGGDQREAIRTFGKRLKVLHIHDNDGVRDCHWLPKMGTIDWNGFVDTLKEVGYEGTLNLEIKPLPYISATLKAFEYVKALTLSI